MKIAIASEGKDEDSEISSISGRAPYYLIFENKKLVKAIKNPFRVGGGGAGFSIAQMLGNEEVNAVISGKFGANIKSALEQKGIKIFAIKNKKVREVLKDVLNDAAK